MGFSFGEMIAHMGPDAIAVAIVLLLMSMVSLAVAVDRVLAYSRARNQSQAFAGRVAPLFKQLKITEAARLGDTEEFKHSYLARIVKAAIDDFVEVAAKHGIDADLATVKSAMDRAVSQETLALRRGMTILATVSSTAPFVGLLGTVLGVINAFAGISAAKSAGIGAVAGGISEALIETAFGLVVAIPSVWVYNYFNGRVDNFGVEMNNSVSEMVDFFAKNRVELLEKTPETARAS